MMIAYLFNFNNLSYHSTKLYSEFWVNPSEIILSSFFALFVFLTLILLSSFVLPESDYISEKDRRQAGGQQVKNRSNSFETL